MGGLKKILVVDDEAGIRSLLFDLLSSEGYKVTLAKDGRESLDQMKHRRFDLLITDINMPVLNGIELLRRMKEAGRRERVIVMTGKPVDESNLGTDLQPVFTLLQKPFQVHNLLEMVFSALARIPQKPLKRGTSRRRKLDKCYIN
jgi:two-component system, response regulator, stage 0 sporulation protein F